MKFLSLLTAAYVGGSLRHPHEGVVHVGDDEAEKLVADGVATDVTADFSAKQADSLPEETNTAPGGREDAPAAANPHQVEVAPQPADAKPARRKASADKE